MSYTQILTSKEEGILTLTIHRPEARNAISPVVVEELLSALNSGEDDPEVRVVVITGSGEKAFSAGGDLGGGGSIPTPYERYHLNKNFARLLKTIYQYPKPTIARVNGYCLAGAMGIAMACDFVVSVKEAEFGTPEIDRGLFPMMIMAVLFRTIPRRRALELILLGERISAEKACEWGLVNAVVPREELDQKVKEYAEKLKGKSPAVLRLGRNALSVQEDLPLERAVEYLSTMLLINTLTEDAMEGIMAFFEKRPPKWKGK